jgi:hypothetical protein
VFGRNKKKKSIPMHEFSERLRGFILDSQIQEAHELSVMLGCSVISEEVAEKEEQESDKRVDKISYLFPLMFQHSHVLAEGAVEYQRKVLKDSAKFPDEVWAFSRKMMEQIAVAALVGSISQLVDMGLLEVPKKVEK